MRTDLPTQPNLNDIKKEVKNLLHALQRGDAVAVNRYHSIDAFADLCDPNIEDAQYIIAREHGYSSWPKLKEQLHITSSSRKR
jgi:hypothetical protein